jgi:hypothetical protein
MISDGYVDAITGSVGRVGRGTCPHAPGQLAEAHFAGRRWLRGSMRV